MQSLLTELYARSPLSRDTAYQTLKRIANGEAAEPEIAAVVSAINMRPPYLTEIQGFRDAMLELAVPFDVEGRDTIDIVGTGGHGKNTFNISTLSCVVVAGAGYPVTKHGSYGVSSNVGSSDVLQALGYTFTKDGDRLRRDLDRAGICFLHAPLFHPAMKNVVPVRKALRVRTFFNLLGPLINPARPRYQLFGTYAREVSRIYDYILQDEPARDYGIVHALDGYDEVSLTGGCTVRGRRMQGILYPRHFGLSQRSPDELYGGETPAAGKKVFLDVLDNRGTTAQQAVVYANAGLAIHIIHPERSLLDCVAEARQSVESGRAGEVLRKLLG